MLFSRHEPCQAGARALKRFQHVSLGPRETKKVTFSLNAEAFGLRGIQNVRKVEPCNTTIWVPGFGSRRIVELEIGE